MYLTFQLYYHLCCNRKRELQQCTFFIRLYQLSLPLRTPQRNKSQPKGDQFYSSSFYCITFLSSEYYNPFIRMVAGFQSPNGFRNYSHVEIFLQISIFSAPGYIFCLSVYFPKLDKVCATIHHGILRVSARRAAAQLLIQFGRAPTSRYFSFGEIWSFCILNFANWSNVIKERSPRATSRGAGG